MNELTTGAKVVLGATIAFLIVSFFTWYEVGNVGVDNMWGGVGVIAGLLLILLLAWQLLRLANVKLEIGVSESIGTAALAVLVLIFTVIRFFDKPGSGLLDDVVDRTFWSWIGLVLAIVIVVGAWLNMQSAGESLSDMRTQFAGAAAAARDAMGRDDAPASSPPASSEPTSEPDAAPDDPAAPRTE